MQTAETLQVLIRERGSKGLPLERVYRMLFNPELYLIAYAKLYRNDGALTPGTNGETVDGMSTAKIKAIINDIRHERYRWKPARRIYIPKKNGKLRPLSIPSWSDKLVQEVIRMILSAYYEPQFSDRSHGFREGHGPHTALREVKETWKGTAWFIEGDIKGCFDNVDHQVLLDILARNIRDNRFIRFVKHMLEAGYMEDWRYNTTYSGTPQGGVVSPLLANVYLNELDQYVTRTLIPKWTKGHKRCWNNEYSRLKWREQALRKQGRTEEAKAVRKETQKLPSVDTRDEGYRRLRYVRYADDYLLGFVGSKAEAENIKEEIGQFLQEHLKLEQSEEKTLVTHAWTEKARFLGYEVKTAQLDDQRSKAVGTKAHNRRSTNGTILLSIPQGVMDDKCRKHTEGGKTKHRNEKVNDSDFSIVASYQSEFRGIVNYYALAYNLSRLNKLRWIMEQALTKTLARKHKTSVKRIYEKHAERRKTDGRKTLVVRVPRDGKEPLVAVWGGIPLTWNLNANIVDREQRVWNTRTELLQRLLANECEYCGSTVNIEVHHIRRVISNKEKDRVPQWLQLMRARRRKTMVLCHDCHRDVTYGRPMRNAPSERGFMWTGKRTSSLRKIINGTGEPDAVNSCTSGSEGGSRKSAGM